jgi:hypothetical protein
MRFGLDSVTVELDDSIALDRVDLDVAEGRSRW